MTPFIKMILDEIDPSESVAYNEAVEEYKKLSPRHQVFVDKAILHGNYAAAYRTAYPDATEGAAKASASRLMKDPVIRNCVIKGSNKARTAIAAFIRERFTQKFVDIYEKRELLAQIMRGETTTEREVWTPEGLRKVTLRPDIYQRIRAVEQDDKLEKQMEHTLPGLMKLFDVLDYQYPSDEGLNDEEDYRTGKLK